MMLWWGNYLLLISSYFFYPACHLNAGSEFGPLNGADVAVFFLVFLVKPTWFFCRRFSAAANRASRCCCLSKSIKGSLGWLGIGEATVMGSGLLKLLVGTDTDGSVVDEGGLCGSFAAPKRCPYVQTTPFPGRKKEIEKVK
jgi:hypothetical protein